MSLKVILVYFSLLAFLSSCVKDNELAKIGDENGAYHNLDIHVNSSDVMDSRAANPAEIAETIADVALFVVDNNSREILDVSMMQKKSEGLYSCLIPSAISLTTSNFYAVANVGANFTNIPGMKGKTLDFLLDTKLQPNNTDNTSASVSPLHYVFMNNTAATYNQATNSISNITLSRLPSRIYLDCTKLGYPVEKITFKNIAKQTTLRTIIDKRGNVTDADVLDWQDTDPQITAQGKSYYYLVYPSRKNAAIIITANGQERQVDLGEIKPGSTYTLRINYPQDINFDGITTPEGVLNTIVGDNKTHEFQVSNTAHIRTVRFTSSDPKIFTVIPGTGDNWYKFTIHGVNPGEATLTAICDGVTITCKIIVTRALGALTVTVNGTPIGSYNTGDVVRVNAPFVEFKKFSSWTANPLITATNKPSFTFTMPQHNVVFTASYADAPYKLTVNKPGRIANDRSGTIDTALIQQTAINDVRYYEINDEVCITIPNEDKLFKLWGSTSYQINTNLNAISGGGNDKPTSWFIMPNIANDHAITPELKPKPYWSSRATAKGHIIANFVDRINPAEINGSSTTIPGEAKFGRAYTEVEKSAIMRALNKIENIFADAPPRPVKITFSITPGGSSISGGGTEPLFADRNQVHESYDLPKLKWEASDMGGRATGKDAASSKFEALWRDKKNIFPDDADDNNNFVGFCDGYVTLYDKFVSHHSMYKGESIEGFNSSATDFETVIMHEVAHMICYHASSKNYVEGGDGLTALDVYIGEEKDPNKSLVNGNFTKGGPTQIVPLLYSEAVKKRLNYYPIISPGDFSHLNFDGLGAHQYMHMWEKKQYRRFADFELDMLQEMGWKINPDAWQVRPS